MESTTPIASLKSPYKIQKQSSITKALLTWLLSTDRQCLCLHQVLLLSQLVGGEGKTMVSEISL